MRLSFTCVASPAHALHGLGREATLQDLKHHRQVVTRDSGVQRRLSAPWLEAEQRWTVTNLTTAIRALKQGLGFAWVPTLQIQRELSLGELVAVPLDQGGIRYGQLYLVYNDRDGAGPATRYLTQLLIDTCTELEINAASASGLPVD